MDTGKDTKNDLVQDISTTLEGINTAQCVEVGKNSSTKTQGIGNSVPSTQILGNIQLCDDNNSSYNQPMHHDCSNDMSELMHGNAESIFVAADSIAAQSDKEPKGNENNISCVQSEHKQIKVASEVDAVKEEKLPAVVPEETIYEYTFGDRGQLASDVTRFISENFGRKSDYVKCHERLIQKFPVLKGLSLQYFDDICRSISKFVGEQHNNLYVAFVLFYIYTLGKYPQQYWAEAVIPAEQTSYAAVCAVGKQFSAAIASESDVQNNFERVMKDYQRAAKRKYVFALMRDDDGLGMVNIYEMFCDIFINKYCNYNVLLWKRTIDGYLGKSHIVRQGTRNSVNYRCEYADDGEKVQIYAVSYMGCQEKPMHVECEDYCFTEFYDDDTWLAVSCDGVGSCAHSSLGSWAATGALSAVLGAYLTENDMLKHETKGSEKCGLFSKLLSQKNKKAITDNESWGNLMYYLQNTFASEVYKFWRETVIETQRELGIEVDDISQYTTTLQFAFGCKAFVACGRVGDGRYFVKKHEGEGKDASFGGFLLNDGISGVTQAAIYTIAHLKRNPHAMQISFFNPDELDDIIISSDGCDGYFGDSVPALLARADEFSALPFKDRCEKLAAVARLCAEVNRTMYGSGDDSTIVHIHFKR